MSNRLSGELSPYLLQHAGNPVDWSPWCPEALAEARERDVPILLSIGYAACHWCHVMERESFEDPVTAAYMNEHFVPIKVDREERPDLDATCIEFVQSLTGHGGWPLTVFLDPDGVPFHGGTYFPPEPRFGVPSFMAVMEAVVEAFGEKREEIAAQAQTVIERLSAVSMVGARSDLPNRSILETATEGLAETVDTERGGFGPAPKFPPASALDFMLSHGLVEQAIPTLDRMAAGGLWDQLAGGFCRYSVDAEWQVPHFEKMLYDNALLARTYLHAWQQTDLPRFRRITTETLDWALDEMTNPEGGFHASLDADSEGVEGLFYTWESTDFDSVLDELSDIGRRTFGVTDEGNFEGRNVLHIPGKVPPDNFEGDASEARRLLLEARSNRVRPATDDKAVCSWNALMVSALAEAGAVLGEDRYLEAARSSADFIWTGMRTRQGGLLRVWREGQGGVDAFLEDHSFLLEAMLDLWEATFETVWFDRARALAETLIERFADPDRGGFFITPHDREDSIARRKDIGDHPIPSGSSSAALGLLRLWALTGEDSYRRHAESVLKLLGPAATRRPDAFGHLLKALDFALGDQRELAISWPGSGPDLEGREMVAAARSRYRPNLVTAAGPAGAASPPLLRDRVALDGHSAAYLCRRFACQAPTASPAELAAALDA